MKKLVNFTWILLMFATPVLAQRGGGLNKEKVDALKVGFITKKLNLSAEEAQKFWPVYNKFHEELERNRKDMKTLVSSNYGNFDKLSQADAEKVLHDMQLIKTQELEISKQYTAEFKKVIPTQKVIMLFVAEHEFKRELLRQLKGQRGR